MTKSGFKTLLKMFIVCGLLFVFSALMSGCSVIDQRINEPIVKPVETLENGDAHYYDVMTVYGAPKLVSANQRHMVFLYESVATREEQVGIGFAGELVPFLQWLKFSFGWSKADHQILLLVFDDKGILRVQEYRTWDRDLGDGYALQILVSASEIVDTSDFNDQITPNEWGETLLRPLPEVLNMSQSLDTGQNGLELLSTPTKAGQHSLEMR